MKTIKNDRKRAAYFNSIIQNYANGNISDANNQVNSLSKIDLVRFVNKLRFYGYKLYVDIDRQDHKTIKIFEE
jgi:hypothetical protein